MDERFFARDVVSVAVDLLGARLLIDGAGGRIVETEAYRQDDEASHSFRGQTAANAAMFGEAGRAYVYRSYGLHWCFNIVCQRGSAVLIRALEPTHGLGAMMERRSITEARKLCAGPGNLCKALGVTVGMNGLSVFHAPFSLKPPSEAPVSASGVRIGISKAAERPWRFAVKGSPSLSRPI
ncbi:DNA-3-methyladenine glycosylase [Sinorhizobium sp. RAC02]|uniref:DNA-3-methyladenine glycosylase n=1 Tax=Sinorhizobium sp. RAC02 TaxID=1842534 RepID=UPI00083DD89D|nr:DNA-3-methyladenine glycosylase [Sinorhizobium sp. RAC02]AOF94149.1 DNA-3-methyladenine glycosylase family protein [Sinorhizobium sp. RAC02]